MGIRSEPLPRWIVAPANRAVEIELQCDVANVQGFHCEDCQQRASAPLYQREE